MSKFLSVLIVICSMHLAAKAQENSPYSRYGLGDMVPNHNIFTRGMGGISAGILDYQSINFTNPASLAGISNTIFDIGSEISIRSLKNISPAKKFSSANAYFSYLQLGFPLTTPKMQKKGMKWGMSFGLRPVSRINYKIEKNERLTGIDSLNTVYEGNGGVNQAFIGTGLKYKNLSFGLTAGYIFGNKDYSTKLNFINDSVVYYFSNSANKTTFSGFFLSGGMQYEIILNKDKKDEVPRVLRLGMYGNLQQNIKASSDDVRETISYDAVGNVYRVDSVYEQKDVKGNIKFPSMIAIGFSYQERNWMYGADIELANWANYRYYGQSDQVQNSWTIRAGAQYFPAKENTPSKKYFSFVRYRAGFFYGPDYIKVTGNMPNFGFTLGTGMPLTSLRRLNYSGERAMLNTAIEMGGRGNKNSSLRESTFRFNIGISMNANWFIKRKYD